MAVHVGAAVRRDDRWYGPALDEAHRIASVGHGGQIVASEVVASMVDIRLTDLGEHQLRDIEGSRRLFQVDGPGGPSRFPPLRSIGSYRTTLPAQRTTLIGRDQLVSRVCLLLDQHRLVTLVGPGGIDKTRVAIDAAGRALRRFPGGVFFADLTRATAEVGVGTELLRAMKVSAGPGQSDELAIAEFLADRGALLLMDNCEHVIERAAETIDDVVVAAPEAQVLATSREPLRLHGEHRLVVPALDVDGPASPSVRLFIDRATAADGASVTDAAAVASVARIVRRLDGIPLAIELAAAQTATHTPSEIVGLLDDRFALLAQRLRRVPPRQQTLAATIDWSYDLLDDEQRRAFRRVSACAGPLSLATAARILDRSPGQTAALLGALSAKSLLVAVHGDDGLRGYSQLETLREYGRAKAAEADESERHRLAVEVALLPRADLLADWTLLVNDYLCSADTARMIEDTTRLEAATMALAEGRLDQAALLFVSVAYREDIGALRARVELVERRTELTPVAWLAAFAAKLLLERGSRDYGACLDTAATVLATIDQDHPARDWFGLWRSALITAVDPVGGTEVDRALPAAYRHAKPHSTGPCRSSSAPRPPGWPPSGASMRPTTSPAKRRPGHRRARSRETRRWRCECGSATCAGCRWPMTCTLPLPARPATSAWPSSARHRERSPELRPARCAPLGWWLPLDSDRSSTSPRPSCWRSHGWRSRRATWPGLGRWSSLPRCTTRAPKWRCSMPWLPSRGGPARSGMPVGAP